MQTVPDLRRLRAERRLFEVHGDLASVREEVAVLGCQLATARRAATVAHRRALAAETPAAQWAWEAARRKVEVTAAGLAAALGRLAELEAARDAALGELLVPLA